MAKIRIQRKRRPWLFHETKWLFALGNLPTRILKMVATYGGNAEKEKLVLVQIENRRQDTRLKSERESYVVAQSQRLELLNAEKRLQLIEKYGDKFYEAMGEKAPASEFDGLPHTV